ncbi:hypothetical protein OAJ02_06570 [Nitrosopumilus sp.]|nr:hypothetical protein [Nitrosopumilus sp.]
MKQLTITETTHQLSKATTSSSFFPRIIREFEDDDEPMYYGDNS